MGGRHAATTQGFHGKEGVLLAVAHPWASASSFSLRSPDGGFFGSRKFCFKSGRRITTCASLVEAVASPLTRDQAPLVPRPYMDSPWSLVDDDFGGRGKGRNGGKLLGAPPSGFSARIPIEKPDVSVPTPVQENLKKTESYPDIEDPTLIAGENQPLTRKGSAIHLVANHFFAVRQGLAANQLSVLLLSSLFFVFSLNILLWSYFLAQSCTSAELVG